LPRSILDNRLQKHDKVGAETTCWGKLFHTLTIMYVIGIVLEYFTVDVLSKRTAEEETCLLPVVRCCQSRIKFVLPSGNRQRNRCESAFDKCDEFSAEAAKRVDISVQ